MREKVATETVSLEDLAMQIDALNKLFLQYQKEHPKEEPVWIRVSKAAEMTGKTPKTIHNWMEEGKVSWKHDGCKLKLVSYADIKRLMN